MSAKLQSRQKRIVITGIGMVTPLGSDRESTWSSLKQGRSGTAWLRPSAVSRHSEKVPIGTMCGARCSDISTEINVAEPVVQYALSAANEAITDADLALHDLDRDRVGCVVGTSKGGLAAFERAHRATYQGDVELNPYDWTAFWPNSAATYLSNRFDLRGPSICPIAACATGLNCVVRAADLIRDDYCDAVIAGSSDASLCESVLASFHRLGVLARGFDDPATACRPFDRDRSGFLVGEGAAIMILEDAEHAAARGALPYAEYLGAAIAADHSGLTQLEASADGLTRLIQDVLRCSEVTSEELDYANLHGTATRLNDVCETRAVKQALGTKANRLKCSSLKGSVGHLLGAAGSFELASTVLAMRDSTVPPTINLFEADSECDLDYTPNDAIPQRIEHALKLSLGFGGHQVACVLRRGESDR
ncbi:MAG: 3-oxoacyl-ACP synthase [Planctomycetaceae bacterium]|nr:3-oxoacyl-ACP synthase [Planctomycetaceae bacterium]